MADQPNGSSTEPARTVGRIFTATLVIGVPGSGKTTLYRSFAEYLWETYRKVLLLYSWDGGAIPTDVQTRMKQGLIRFWRARTRSAPGLALETLYLASKGYFPRYINAETGETSPAVQLVPPVTVSYEVSCPKGHRLSTVPAPSLITPMFCTPCGQFIGMPDLRVLETAVRTKGFEQVGGVGFDGLTSMTDVVLDHMDLQRGEGNIGGEKAAFGGVVKSGSVNFGGNNRADVGFGQSRGHQFVNNSLSIPYLVEGPVFTALTMEATDEGGLSIVGPKLPGRAATDEASAWFGNVMETGKSPDESGRPCFTLWLRPFVDAQNRRHLLKTSASPTGVPDSLRDPPAESHQPYSVVNLGSVFKMLDEDLRRSLQEELPGSPGIPSAQMEYGEALTITAGVAAPDPVQTFAPGMVTPLPTPVAQVQPAAIAQPVAAVEKPAIPAPPTMAGAPVTAAAPTNGGAATMMVAQPRARRRAGAATTQPIPVTSADAAGAGQAAQQPIAAAPLAVVSQPAPPAAAATPPSSPAAPAGLPAAGLASPPQPAPATASVHASPAVGTTGGIPIVPGAVAAPSGAAAGPTLMTPTPRTGAPPPPGMRPPMKVPGA